MNPILGVTQAFVFGSVFQGARLVHFMFKRGFLFLLGADTVPQNPQLCFGVDFAYFARVVERGQAVHLQLAKCWGMANLQFG